MKYAVVTFGCRVNQADSLEIEGQLRALGGVGAAPAEADLVVVNTCSVTAAADQGARQTIRRVARDNPSARIVVTGCYATRAPGDKPFHRHLLKWNKVRWRMAATQSHWSKTPDGSER
jgi:threonylcarbamoyladenosine tRNA methylthiotransferase MtaB